MKYECCSKQKLRYEIESWFENLKRNEILKVEISKCPVLRGTYDLWIIKLKKEKKDEKTNKNNN